MSRRSGHPPGFSLHSSLKSASFNPGVAPASPAGETSSVTSLVYRWLMRLVPALVALATASCAPSHTLVNHRTPEAIRHETFPYRKWIREGVEPDTVVIALHGFSGASIDYENLAAHLLRHKPHCALYAYEVRGQGRDPKKHRRGDIDDPANWSLDLLTFTHQVRQAHPRARIVWFGESMGGLILAHTYRQQLERGHEPPCHALGITSPVVNIRDDFPDWKKQLLLGAAKLTPTTRISLETLSGGAEVPMTATSFHSEQSETNAWHVEKHTLRLLATLGGMIEAMPECAATFRVPTLIVHGGKDFFTTPGDVESFTQSIPETTRHQRLYYPDGHHLLMYDRIKDQVIADIAGWLEDLGRSSK